MSNYFLLEARFFDGTEVRIC